MTLAELIGPMLGSALLYVDGVVEVDLGGEVHRERFWTMRGQRWRVEGDDGITHVSDAGRGSVTLVHGSVRDAGPPLPDGFFAADRLLRPRTAGIWGRPGEDWRMSDRIEPAPDGLVRLTLQPVDTRWPAHCLVDPASGWLHELVTGPRRLRLLEVEEVPPAGLDVDELFLLPDGDGSAGRRARRPDRAGR